jgi:hypothetical protein
MSSFDLDDFDNPPEPPRYLFKYLSVARVGNVLEQGTVRFTPLLNTNDSFEVRSTFRKLAGPRFLKMLAEQMDIAVSEASVDAMIAEQLQKIGLGWFPPKVAMQMLEAQHGGNFMQTMRKQMQEAVDTHMLPLLNDPKNSEKMLEKLGRELLCFSLSERADSAPMWAHYADNHQGFVVAFDTNHDWFKNRKDGKKTRIQKVTYFDGMIEEPLENVSAAFISKTTDWAYEHEWRLYAKVEQVDSTFGTPNDPIHVLNFPVNIVDRVIMGSKASADTIENIRCILKMRYPHARLTRANPNRETHSFDELDI